MAGATEFRIDLDEKFPHLGRAPIVEAVIHWTAKPDQPFIADDLQRTLRDTLGNDYPKIERGSVHQFGFRVDAEGASTQQASRWQGFRLTSADGRYIAQFNQDGLVFSRLAPYENWERFTAEGRRLWRVFCGLGAISEIQRLGVRFINRIPLGTPTDVNRFLRRPPQVLEDLNLPRGGFLIVTNHDLPHEPLRVEIIQTIQPPAPLATDGHGLILDIDVITTSGFPCGDPSLDKFLVTMHWLKNKVFFALITDEAVHLLAPERP